MKQTCFYNRLGILNKSNSLFSQVGIAVLMSFVMLACNPEREENPNIVLIMGDDIGFSDLGSYGSEIQTPNLDKLAENGIRFRTFYNSAKCNPSRSSLLTGLYKGNNRAVNIASLLDSAGYTTLHSGKEHFDGWVPDHVYAEHAFDQSFTFWATTEYFVPPNGEFSRPFFLNGKQLATDEIEVYKKPLYKTEVITDYAIRFLDQEYDPDIPFFLYLPYHAAHYPLQARPEDIAKYLGKYRKGWDSVRQERYERMLAMGIIDDSYSLSEPTDNINRFRGHPKGDTTRRSLIPKYRPWSTLSESEKDEMDLEMAVFAAMVDCMDQNIGRVISWLKDHDEFENTLIMYLSDNGSCPYDANKNLDIPPGPAESYRSLSAAWANVGNTPFKYFKQFGHEGGPHTQFIVHWPKKIKKGLITDQVGHITDIYPTLLDVAGINYPDEFDRVETIPLHGKSLMPIFEGQIREEPAYFISGFSERFRMFRTDSFKIVRSNKDAWELYNIKKDPTEGNNLAKSKPVVLTKLIAEYQNISQKMNAEADNSASVRSVKDTIGFAQYAWQMDSIIRRLDKRMEPHQDERWKTVIAPHDDYKYAGEVTYETLSGIKAKTVILFGVAHRARNFNLEDQMVFGSFTHWNAPYGKIPISGIQEDLLKRMPEDLWLVHDSMQEIEHSLEAMIPFLQNQNRDLEIIPILVPAMNLDRMDEIAESFSRVLGEILQERKLEFGKDVAIVISNDAVHYGDEDWGGKNMAPFGSDSSGNQKARQLEQEIISTCLEGSLSSGKIQKFVQYTVQETDHREYKWTWCGRYAVPLGLSVSNKLNQFLFQEALSGQFINYASSIDHALFEVEDIRMGTTAPANSHHWVGYVGMGYK